MVGRPQHRSSEGRFFVKRGDALGDDLQFGRGRYDVGSSGDATRAGLANGGHEPFADRIYDDREDSPTHGMLDIVELGRPDAYRRLRIPAGLWYGFQCLGAQDALIANCADLPHNPSDNEIVEPKDSPIPYEW